MRFRRFLKQKLQMLSNRKGAILLEFAFAIPVLIMCLYFVLDVPHIYRLANKMHKLSEIYSLCILNVIKSRDSKLLTKADLINISRGIGIGITGVVGNTKYPYNLSTYIYYVKGTGTGFSVVWTMHVKNSLKASDAPSASTENSGTSYSLISGKTLTALPGDWKDFEISNGEEKIVVETVLWSDDENGGLSKLFYLLPIAKNQFGNQIAAITPANGMLDGENPPS